MGENIGYDVRISNDLIIMFQLQKIIFPSQFGKIFSIIIIIIIIIILTPWSSVLLEKLTGSAASQEIPCIFGTRMFLTVLTSARSNNNNNNNNGKFVTII